MVDMVDTLINEKWHLKLPDHRAARAEWPHWEYDRLASIHSAVRSHMERIVDLGDVGIPLMLDVGAEEGDFSALFASWGCDVVGVEPNPKVWPNIKAIFEANDLRSSWIDYYVGLCGAAFNEYENEGLSGVQWPDCANGPLIGNHGFVSLVESGRTKPVTTIDRIRERLNRRIDFITMDIEGAELRALEGATEVLKYDKPVIWVSVHDAFMQHDYGCNREDLLRYMRNLGYRCEWLQRDHEEHWKFSFAGGWL